MKKTVSLFLAVMLCIGGTPLEAPSQQTSASLVGTVTDTQGNPVTGVRIIVQDQSGKLLSEALSNAAGQYSLKNLPLGQYTLTLDPAKSGYLGETVVASLSGEGLTVNWIVSTSAKAIAIATQGIALVGGLGPEGVSFLGFLYFAGTLLGLTAATGAFRGPKGPASPSL